MHRAIVGMLIVFATMLGSSVVTALEKEFLKAVLPIRTTQTSLKQPDPQKMESQKLEEKAANDIAVKQVQILRDSFLMLWLVGGVIPGSTVGVVLRNLSGYKAMTHATVSICTALPVTPYLLKRYSGCTPEECFLGGFVVAVSAWAAWEVVLICYERIKKAAADHGIGGVMAEVQGKAQEIQKP